MAKQHPKYGYWYDHSPEEWREVCRTHSTALSVTGRLARQMTDGQSTRRKTDGDEPSKGAPGES